LALYLPFPSMVKKTHRAIIDLAQFELGDQLVARLMAHGVAVATFPDISQDARLVTDFLVLSSMRAAELGGQSGVIGAAKRVGAKSVLIMDRPAKAYKIETELGARIVTLSLPLTVSDFHAVQFVTTLLHGTNRALVESDHSRKLYELAGRIAQSDVSVFISGPTGSGKEIMARFIHDQSPRSDNEFVAVNCAAIPDNMLEAMMFGHEKGSFTGASTANIGVIRAADGGTLLLDEISEMSLQLQAKLLRAIQELMVTPIGGTKQIKVDLRILATSNRDMWEECRLGRFREDLFYRLNVFPIATQALSERPEDILPIAQTLIMRHVKDVTQIPMLAPCALNMLIEHSWPGNVRELENVIQRALVLSTGTIIKSDAIMIDKLNTVDVKSKIVELPVDESPRSTWEMSK
jgi:two-component system response regulator FlrC